MSNSSKRDLTAGPVTTQLWRMAIPGLWGMAALFSVQLIDLYFVGKLGPEALAAIGFTFPITLLLSNFAYGFSSAMNSVVSRAIGAGNRDKAMAAFTGGIVVTALLSALVMIAVQILEPIIFKALGADDGMILLIGQFMGIWLMGLPLMTVLIVAHAAVRATGEANTPSLVMMAVALLNVILNPILIFGWGPIPGMGLSGSAMATVIAYAAGTLCLLFIAYRKTDLLHIAIFRQMALVRETLREWLDLVLPIMTTNLIGPITIGLITAMVGRLDDASVAAYGMAMRIEAFVFIPWIVFSGALAPVVGQNWGAGLFGRVREAYGYSIRIIAVFYGLLAVLLALGGPWVAGIFTDDADIARLVALFLLIAPIAYIGVGVFATSCAVYNAAGQGWMTLRAYMLKIGLLTLPTAYFGIQNFGFTGAAAAGTIANIVGGVVIYLFIRRLFQSLNVSAKNPL